MSDPVASNGEHATSAERAELARLLEHRRIRLEPLSYGQAALWHLYQLAPENSAYNTAFTARVSGPLDLVALRRAIVALVRRHATLRTTYHFASDRPVQAVHRELPVDWADLDALHDTEAELRARVTEDCRRPFNLERGPILRVRVYRVSDGQHLLVIAVHHIAIDFTSLRTLVADLGELYRAECSGVAADLAPLRAEYSDFARAQRARLAGPESNSLLEFWQRELAGAPARLDVANRSRGAVSSAPAAQTFRGATYSLVIDADLVRRIAARSATENATLYHTLCTTLAVLLSRHSGETDIVFGITTSSRDRLELENVVGYFINTPPLRVDIPHDATARDLIAHVRQKALAVLEHADYPLLLMAQKLEVQRDPSYTPIFQVSFNMLHQHAGGELSAWWGDIDSGARIDFGGPVLEPFPVPLQDGILDLSVWACEVGDRLYLEFKYNTELFDHAAVARMAQHYRTLLEAVASDPARPVRALPMLAAPEQEQILHEWNATALDYDRQVRLDALFDAQAHRTPNAVAVAMAETAWRYDELADHSDRLAAHLQSLGAGPGTLVAISMDRRIEMLSAVLAVVKAGAAYVPIDPTLPPARTASLLSTHGIRFAITDAPAMLALRDLPAVPLAHVVSVDPTVAAAASPPAWREWGAGDWIATAPARARVGTSDDIAYVIFTSGSTGTPKGVVVRHRPVINLIEWVNRTFAIGPADRVLCVSSLSFDLSVYDIFGVLAAGGTVRLAATAELQDPERLLKILVDEPITFWNSAPAVMQQLVPLFPAVAKTATHLRLAFFSGDWIPLTLPADLRRVFSKVQVISLGGATEAVVWSNFFPIADLDPSWVSIPYGRPIQNARYYVLNDALQPCPVGVAGDLYIGGECLASGYLNDPALTASKFVRDPFVAGTDGIMYRTGDRARFFPDGNIEFLGRLDDQVKIRGFRIELGEIEAALRAHPEVQDCAITAIGERAAKRIVAYLVARAPSEITERAGVPGSASLISVITHAGEQTRHSLWLSDISRTHATVHRPPSSWVAGTRVGIALRATGIASESELGAIVASRSDTSAVLQFDAPRQGDDDLAAWGWRPPSPTVSAADAKLPGGSAESLRAYLRERLPEYMVPAHFVGCDRLPVTANGKVDRRALPDPGAGEINDNFVAPSTPTEVKLAAIWADVLRTDRVSVQASFFDLGGHSLLATQLLARIRAELGIALPLRVLFTTPTIAALSAEISSGDDSISDVLPSVRSDAARRFEPFSLTDVQQAYWVGRRDDFETGGVSTQLYQEFDLRDIDLPRLTRALQALVVRHDGLRTIVRPDGLQQVLPQVPSYEIELIDLTSLTASDAEARLAALREERCYRVRDASQWPLFDVCAAQIAPGTLRLFVSIDVLIADARSLGILGVEWIQLYEQPELALPPLEITFRDYAAAESDLRGLPIYQRSIDYWRRRIPELPGGPDLPLAKPPHTLTRPRFVRRTTRLDRDTWAGIKKHAARAGVTPAAALAAAYAEVLSAWSRTGHFILNLTLLQRLPLHPQAQDLVGDFTSLTLLEVDTTKPVAFAQRARTVHDQLWNDLDHRYVGGVQVMRERAQVRPGSGISYMPVVFTCVLDALPDDPGVLTFLDRHATAGFGIAQTPQVWLDYQAIETSGGLTLNWDGLHELFPAGMLDAMFAAHLALLLQLADSAGWEHSIGALVPSDQRARHDAANNTALALPVGLLHTPFQDRAREHPEAVAVISSSRTLSYGELRRRATAVARWLRARGARPGDLVGVVMEKGWEQIVAALGILEAGAAYVPAEASLPEQRIHRLLALAQVKLVVTQSSHDERLDWPSGLERLVVDRLEPTADDDVSLAPVQTPSDLAYVIFTSGSTGEPKGVVIQHAAASNTVVDINLRYQVGPRDRVFGVSALGFDLSVWDIFGILGAGGAVVLPDPSGLRDPAYWTELAQQHGVTIWNSVPALMDLVVDHLEVEPQRRLPLLRLVLMSGDWIPVGLPARIRARAESAEIVSLGGATEAAIWSVFYPIGDVDPAWRSIPYGKPLANQQLLVLDTALRSRPDWVTGDLYIAGVGLAHSYWNDPVTTAKSFIIDPATGTRLYRTGDLARYLPTGDLEFLGRVDHQVKIHGHRIELGEIESTLLDHPDVHAAAVIVRPAANKVPQLEAYVVFRDGVDDCENVRTALRQRLPSYMVPAVFVRLDALPLSGNGKIDRAALRPPESATPLAGASEAPRGRHEELVAEVWSKVLEVAVSSRDDNFFVCGGDSIRAIQVIQHLRRRLPSLAITVADLYAAQTVSGLAAHLDRSIVEPVAAPPPTTSAERFDEIERLPAEQRAYLAAEFEDVYPANRVQHLIIRESAEASRGAGVYHLQQMLECQLVDAAIEVFREALTAVVARVRALRSVFLVGICDHPLVAVRRAADLAFPEEDLRGMSRDELEARLDAIFAEDRATPFDVTNTDVPLVRFRLLRRSDTELTLFFSIHHALWDGWSNTEFYSQVRAAYERIRARLPEPAAPPIDVSREFVAWERRKLEADGAEARAYWAEQLASPTTRPARRNSSSVWQPPAMFFLEANEFSALEQLARDLRVTTKALLLRTFLDMLSPDGGELTVGVVANRRSDELTDPWAAMGLFWNIVPFRFSLTSNQRSDALAIHSQLLRMETHAWYPLHEPRDDRRRPEPYHALFNFIHLHNFRTGDDRGLQFRGLRAYDKYHLPLNSLFAVTPSNRGLSIRLEYDPRWYDADEIADLGTRLLMMVRAMAGVRLHAPPKSSAPALVIPLSRSRARGTRVEE